ncbi:tetratricopeptide repeat protein [Aureivirga sp. CE67]|uniref:type IX secretion system periplasmic lipoprotein PorW/SprE n=1 Tax=Aureivirga sp. CE67 TaxID=1788983 RepID=UPI0018CB45EA|nr:tetratricopeptide repeat protein [Aureivirga sp. CE67]
MKRSYYIYFGLVGLLAIVSCSTRKNKFLNRQYHGLTTKYNVLYNGKLAYEDGVKELEQNYSDNFWEILPIEPIKIEEQLMPTIGEQQKNTSKSFERAEEKAVKAVQKHSMNIGGKERNSQTDEAFFLLGKSRYYSQRFVPALEAFNYVIKKYPDASLINETIYWKAKTEIRLRNQEQAISELKKLLERKKLPDAIREKANTALAMAYYSLDSVQHTIDYLKSATRTSENKAQTARNLFILGQLYRSQEKLDSSNNAFYKVAKMKKIPYKYRINAELEKVKNIDENSDLAAVEKKLKKLERNRDNRPYLEQIYYHLGNVKRLKKEDSIAAISFKKGLRQKITTPFQKELSYEKLGDIYFDEAKYSLSGSYYDSVLEIAKYPKSKRVRRIKRKRKNLENVIKYEELAHRNDSILYVANLSPIEQQKYYQKYIDALKKKEEEERQRQLNANLYAAGNGGGSSIGPKGKGGKWYFYNAQTVGFGKGEFKKKWGTRPLEDNWRLSDKSIIKQNDVEDNEDVASAEGEAKKKGFSKYDVNFYIFQVPVFESELDSIKGVRDDAYYNLGLIYKEDFKKYPETVQKLEKLLDFQPKEFLVLPTKYNLYKTYLLMEDQVNSDKYKEDITKNYPESRYALIITNPEQLLARENDESSPENIYKKIFVKYKNKLYTETIKDCEKAIGQFADMPLIPKFELLKAYAVGKKQGKKDFIKALEFVALNYPNTEEGKKASEVMKILKDKK